MRRILGFVLLIGMFGIGMLGVAARAESPILVLGEEQRRIDMARPDGGVLPVVGVANIQLLRACRSRPELADGDGWTYAHHMDLAVWKGWMYAAWAMTPRDEDVPPYKVVYATSTDGLHWSVPVDLFPRTVAWANRFYFYRAGNGHMLAFCAGKAATGNVSEAVKNALLVREIFTDHQLGEVFTLIEPGAGLPPPFTTSSDAAFVAACRDALNNHPLLEQQDYGVYLGAQRMPWQQNPPSAYGLKFGKAFSFYHRRDGQLVGICKMGFVTVSADHGQHWSPPVLPPTLVAGSGKVWGQQTDDGRYALVYNPDHARRWPLICVSGNDGVTFRDMRVVHGEMPRLRYAGKYKDNGAQYVRGLAEWSDDGTFADRHALWLIYSVNKEDIWISRVPLPLPAKVTDFPRDDFERDLPDTLPAGWNIYSPRWAPVRVVTEPGTRNHCLELRDADPYDYARATRLFHATTQLRSALRIKPMQAARLEIELGDDKDRFPVRVVLQEDGHLHATDGRTQRDLGAYQTGVWLTLAITADATTGKYAVSLNGKPAAAELAFAETTGAALQQLSLRTNAARALGEGSPVNPTTDIPVATPAIFLIDDMTIQGAK